MIVSLNENPSPVRHACTPQLGSILLRFVNDNYSRCLGAFLALHTGIMRLVLSAPARGVAWNHAKVLPCVFSSGLDEELTLSRKGWAATISYKSTARGISTTTISFLPYRY